MHDAIAEAPTGTDMILRALSRFPERRAFVWDGGSLTYLGALALIGRLQAAMAASGLKKGQTVAFLSANNAETWCAGVAASGLGLVTTWLHPLGALSDQLDVIEDGEVSALIVDARTHAQRGGEIAAKAADRLKVVLTMGKADFGRDLVAAAERIGEASAVNLATPDDYSVINYTGVTTGKSKGAIRRHRSTAAMTTAVAADFEFPETPRYLAAAPITHVAGTKVVPALLKGGTVHLMKGFDPERFLDTLEREKINFTLLVPTMVYVLLDHPKLDKTDLSSLELILYGASPMPESLVVEAQKYFPKTRFVPCYGMTESTASVTSLPSFYTRPENWHLGKANSIGRALIGCDLAIVDAQDRFLPAGENGEIVVRGPLVMKGYWNQPELTAQTLRNGWLHTGDLGYMDEIGIFHIVDRLKDMIISGGENVYSAEVEAALYAYPGVAQCAVIGIPHEK